MKLIHETISAPTFPSSHAELAGYLLPNYPSIDANRLHPAVLILPGGGYNHISERENEPVALAFLAANVHAFILTYSIAPAVYPQALCETLLAIHYIRTHAAEYHIDPDCIALCGFSAAGHLALTAGAFYQDSTITSLLSISSELLKPNKLILSYPVVSSGNYAHESSFSYLLGSACTDPLLRQKLSMELQITETFPPVFLWHTTMDGTVSVQNSLLLASALSDAKVPFELHVYPAGDHALVLGDYPTNGTLSPTQHYGCSDWFDKAVAFLYRPMNIAPLSDIY